MLNLVRGGEEKRELMMKLLGRFIAYVKTL